MLSRLPNFADFMEHYDAYMQRSLRRASYQKDRRVAALVGRRPDGPNAEIQRFPLKNIPSVKKAIKDTLESGGFTTLVSSAACGADLLALAAANELGLETYVLLPFTPSIFRELSVTDRPGDWTLFYDSLINRLKLEGTLRVLTHDPKDENAYKETNKTLVSWAVDLAGGQDVTGILVWDGKSRGAGDATQQFADICGHKGIPTIEISTLV